eukprot:NODE_286_length_10728_cov_0.553298.p3 type:complete len:456 gc:universal NODE_286_length_10728_cov_0.553298:5950-4583(-)
MNLMGSDSLNAHYKLLDTFKKGQSLSNMKLLWLPFLDPKTLDENNQNIILLTCQLISTLPLYAIRWLVKGLVEEEVPSSYGNYLQMPELTFDEPQFIDTYPNHICIPQHSHYWEYSFQELKFNGKLDTNIVLSKLPRPGLIDDFNTILTAIHHFLTTWALNESQFEPIEEVLHVMCILYDINCKYNLIGISLFYNNTISENIDIRYHFPKWKLGDGFSLCNYPFILTPATKAEVLRTESRVQMRHELQDAFFRAMFSGMNSPYFVLEVRRDFLVRDALYQIETKHPSDLKKQLKVSFVNEDAIDEGGPQKEFFRLIVQKLFMEDNGLFRYYQDTRLWWFALDCSVDDEYLKDYRLVGELIGIAIYNGIFLDISFPLALYKKLLNEPLNLEDLKDLDPQLSTSLKSLLTMDNVALLDLTFEIEIPSVGHVHSAELCLNGRNIMVSNENKKRIFKFN